jgi:ribosome-binding factor A
MDGLFQRADRISDLIKREVSYILAQEVKDPRIDLVTITRVLVSKDLKNAKIFFSTIREGEALAAIQKAVKSAAGFVQRKLASRIQLRYTPHITFVYDSSAEVESRMYKILDDIDKDLETQEGNIDDFVKSDQ